MLLVFLLVAFVCGVHSQTQCITPNGESAQCRNIYNCPVFLEALKNRTPEVIDFLRRSTCGFSTQGDPMVCCGSVAAFANINQQQNTRPTTRTTPRPGRVIKTGGGPPPGTPPQPNPLLPANGQCGESEISDRIIGGVETLIGEFPWMTLLQYRKNGKVIDGFYCGGALISDRYVLTAAHCVVGAIERELGDIYLARLGEWDTNQPKDCVDGQDCNDPPVDVTVEEAVAHEDYQRNRNDVTNRHHDIAIVRLSRPVRFTEFIQPICLPVNGEKAKRNDIVHVAGWGTIKPNTNQYSNRKLKVNMTLFDQSKCADLFKRNNGVNIVNYQLCAGGAKGKDSCNGDSGGPLMKRIPKTNFWYVEGIVSYGPQNCGTEGVPGIYTRVYEYLEWIRANMRS